MNKCRIVNIDRCSLNDGPGIRTVIFFKGCALRCVWCHNPETYQFERQEYVQDGEKKYYGYDMAIEEIEKIIEKDLQYYAISGGGITLSGGEALLQIEQVSELLKFCRAKKIHVCIETSGYVPLKNIEKIIDYVDLWLYDYKLSDEDSYVKYVNAEPTLIYKNLQYIIENHKDVILRCPIIPTVNDNDEHFRKISEISQYVSSVEILPYHNLGKSKAEKLNIMNYFTQENATELQKRQWEFKLKSYHCKKFIIK